MGIDPNDVYFGLVCLASILVLIVILDFVVEYLQKDGKDE